MKITINDQQILSEIRDQFHKEYPYLRLEFFSRPHEIADFSKKKFMTGHNVTLGECRSTHTEGSLDASGNVKVWQIEQEFQKFGLPAQIFRLMGNDWIETIQTDWWTLAEQNNEGKEFSHDYFAGRATGTVNNNDSDIKKQLRQ